MCKSDAKIFIYNETTKQLVLFLHKKFGVPNLQIMFSKETINSFSIKNINNTISLSPININKFILSQKKELEKIYYK